VPLDNVVFWVFAPIAVAAVLFRDYFFPFEATSILLIVAAIAAMVLAQRKVRAITQEELDVASVDVEALS
jgi:hypothetical protein